MATVATIFGNRWLKELKQLCELIAISTQVQHASWESWQFGEYTPARVTFELGPKYATIYMHEGAYRLRRSPKLKVELATGKIYKARPLTGNINRKVRYGTLETILDWRWAYPVGPVRRER